jgi:competence protein ComEC
MGSPLVIITIAYILGISVGKVTALPIILIIFLMLFSLILAACSFLTKEKAGFLILGVFFLLGLLNFQIRNLPPARNDISNFPKNKNVTVKGQIDDEPRIVNDIVFFTLKVRSVDESKASGLISVAGKAAEFNYGDIVQIRSKIEELESLSNPGILSYGDYLRNQGINCRIWSGLSPPKVISGGGGNFLKRFSIALKNRLIIIPQKTLPEPYSTLLTSIVFGTRASRTPEELKDKYKRVGVAHLLVASGMHLGILIGVCLFLVKLARMPLWAGVLMTSIVNFLYALMTGFGPSILRAAIMAEIMLVGLLFEREKEIYTSLALAAFIILLFNPKHLFEVGFQLSFAATWSLVYVAPVINDKLKQYIPRFASVTVSAAIAPVIASVPITLFHFSQASMIGVVTNVLLLPWVGFIVVLGFVSTVLGSIFLPLAELVNGANLILLWLANFIVTSLALLPFAEVYLPAPKFPLIIFYYASVIGSIELLRQGRRPRINKFGLTVIGLAVICVFLWQAAFSQAGVGLKVTVLDVGQGDSILIEPASGKKILIDGGERKMGERVVVPFLRRKGINKLDMVVLTHPHEDHVGGLPAVLRKIKVDSVLDPGYPYKSQSYKRFLGLIKRNKIKYHLARAGQSIDFGQATVARILNPSLPFLENVNNASIVMQLRYKNFSLLLCGDNEKEGEERLLEQTASSLQSAIIKIGHHGSRTATSDQFLAAVNPKIALISCGKHNKFKHPHKSTLDKLRDEGIKIYRTDRDGAIIVKSDGTSFNVKTAETAN